MNQREKLHQHQPCVRIAHETNQIAIGKDKVFAFDYVLAPKVTQNELFETCVKSLVHSVFEGYNATVFAYGQTGSGKTHTISGSSDDQGIIPRAVNAIFSMINQSSVHGGGGGGGGQQQASYMNREFCVKVDFIEIYKEELKDLLDTTEKDLQIRDDESGNSSNCHTYFHRGFQTNAITYCLFKKVIYGANEIICTTLEEVMACFDAGTALRHTGSTMMNEQSSRSHSVFTVSIGKFFFRDMSPKSYSSKLNKTKHVIDFQQNKDGATATESQCVTRPSTTSTTPTLYQTITWAPSFTLWTWLARSGCTAQVTLAIASKSPFTSTRACSRSAM